MLPSGFTIPAASNRGAWRLPTVGLLLFLLAARLPAAGVWSEPLPYRAAGLSERQAAAHLLDRLSFGPRPGEVEHLLEVGPRAWLEGQLLGDLPGPVLAARLAGLPALGMSAEEIVENYSHPRSFVDEAVRAGLIRRSAYLGEEGTRARLDALAALERYAYDRGYRPEEDLLDQLRRQKILRCLLSESQLNEVLSDFWFNHFYVEGNHPAARLHVLDYEREVIRPHALATFRELLEAAARHPALLAYLDNASSAAEVHRTTTFDLQMAGAGGGFTPSRDPQQRQQLARLVSWREPQVRRLEGGGGPGLNENFARELLELHTLGVTGGYDQQDVLEVARAFSGWSTFPIPRQPIFESLIRRAVEEEAFGFSGEGFFLFRADRHDSEPKRVLGVSLAAGRGVEDGEEVLELLALHPATAGRLAHKLALRFVADEPPVELVERLVESWELGGGDLRQMIRTLVLSPEFWQSHGQKIKSPLEFAISALRGLDAEIGDVETLRVWLQRMGQPLYGARAPTGYPERGAAWLQAGPLLLRLNFAALLANDRFDGVSVDLLSLVDEAALGSRGSAVEVFWALLLPGRVMPESMREHLARLAEQEPPAEEVDDPAAERLTPAEAARLAELQRREWQRNAAYGATLVLSSPDFQRR